MDDQSTKRGKSPEPRRFPRFPNAKEVAGLVKLLAIPPTFEVQLEKTEKSISTKLIFTLPMPIDFAKSDPDLYFHVFGLWASGWQEAIEEGYRETKHGDRTLPNLMPSLLQRVLVNGVKIYLAKLRDLPDEAYKKQAVKEQVDFGKLMVSKRGPQFDPRFAFLAAKRYDKLLPAIRVIQSKFRKLPDESTQNVKIEIEKICSYDTYVAAIEPLCGDGRVTAWTICHLNLTPKEIAIAILKCELQKGGYTIDEKRGSIWSHIRLGRKLVQLIASPPELPSPPST